MWDVVREHWAIVERGVRVGGQGVPACLPQSVAEAASQEADYVGRLGSHRVGASGPAAKLSCAFCIRRCCYYCCYYYRCYYYRCYCCHYHCHHCHHCYRCFCCYSTRRPRRLSGHDLAITQSCMATAPKQGAGPAQPARKARSKGLL
ncbi:hypothetical protein K490DRAFT_55398 [Saccharata proteae CBS 121410]|uniref:Uncharacterized protein n=1 Tax=Saccharata proteae CBS 121410 TaxID=1314787 RepID=A0A6A5YAX3_9PEZI|nr:hypothetical protein K490DRAFT_55398 [Saccharata proteae CBS 121410]